MFWGMIIGAAALVVFVFCILDVEKKAASRSDDLEKRITTYGYQLTDVERRLKDVQDKLLVTVLEEMPTCAHEEVTQYSSIGTWLCKRCGIRMIPTGFKPEGT